MAWNKPGGSGGKDPWGNRNNDKGPPDLDEILKKLQDKVSWLFGSRGRSGGGSNGGRLSGMLDTIGLSAIIAVLLAVWALSGIYIVNEGEKAVVLRLGAYDRIEGAGPHWYPRFIDAVDIVNVEQVRSVNIGQVADEAMMLTQDENIVNIKLSVQYNIKNPKNYLFSVNDPNATLRQATESAVREVVGRKTMDDILTVGRGEVASNVQTLTQKILNHYKTGLHVIKVNIQDAQPPREVKPAFLDAINAREDRERVINEAKADANKILPLARGEAARNLQEANAYRDSVIARAQGNVDRFRQLLVAYEKAPKVTRERMYLDTMESVLDHSSKVIIDVKKGSSLIYLPLDKIMQRAVHEQASANAPSATSTSKASAGNARNAKPTGFSRNRVRNREVRR